MTPITLQFQKDLEKELSSIADFAKELDYLEQAQELVLTELNVFLTDLVGYLKVDLLQLPYLLIDINSSIEHISTMIKIKLECYQLINTMIVNL